MEHFRIIETSSLFPDVLLHRDRNEDGEELVKITAVGIISEDENMFAIAEVICEDYETAVNFIKDFSQKSAEKWCEKQGVSYW